MRLIRFTGWLLLAVVTAVGCGCAGAFSGGQVPKGPPVTPAVSICFADPEPVPGSCGALYDSQGRACVVCVQESACVDADTDTRCVGAAGCDDPECGVRK